MEKLEKLAAEALLRICRKDYREYLNRIFTPTGVPLFRSEVGAFFSDGAFH